MNNKNMVNLSHFSVAKQSSATLQIDQATNQDESLPTLLDFNHKSKRNTQYKKIPKAHTNLYS